MFYLGMVVLVLSAVGLGIVIEGATGLSVYVRARLRAWASPHAEEEDENEEDQWFT